MLHILNALLIYAILKNLLARNCVAIGRIAFYSALLFTVHPVNTETVNYITCRSELLAGFFVLLCIYLYIKSRNTIDYKEQNSLYRASLIAFILGLLSKEIAIVIPFIILLFDYIYKEWKDKKGFIAYLKRRFFMYIFISIGYILLRVYLLGHVLGQLKTPIPGRTFSINFLTQLKVAVLYYIKLLFFPIGLSVDRYVPISRSIFELPVIISIVIIFIIVFLAFKLKERYKIITFFLVWFFINIIPTSIVPLKIVMNEHRIYLSSISFCVLIPFLLLHNISLKK